MESQSFEEQSIIEENLKILIESCEYIIEWNEKIFSFEDYLLSSSGMQTMAASCMLIEAIGECIKSIDKRSSDFLESHSPDIPWRNFVGIRNRIAHGYHNLDAGIIFETVKNEIPKLREAVVKILRNCR